MYQTYELEENEGYAHYQSRLEVFRTEEFIFRFHTLPIGFTELEGGQETGYCDRHRVNRHEAALNCYSQYWNVEFPLILLTGHSLRPNPKAWSGFGALGSSCPSAVMNRSGLKLSGSGYVSGLCKIALMTVQ